MASDLYCSRADVTAELPAGEIVGWSRPAAASSSDILTLDGHGLETNDTVTVRAPEGVTLPSPLAEGTTYYAIRLTASTFKLSATAGGAALNLTSSADEIIIHREPNFDDVIEFYSRWADGFLPAHAVPLEAPIHPIVRRCVARCAAATMLARDGKSSTLVRDQELAAKAIIERHAAGIPLRGADVTTSTNLAITDTLVGTEDSRGWGSETLP